MRPLKITWGPRIYDPKPWDKMAGPEDLVAWMMFCYKSWYVRRCLAALTLGLYTVGAHYPSKGESVGEKMDIEMQANS